MRSKSLWIPVMAALSLPLVAQETEQTKLKWAFEKGRTLRFDMEQSLEGNLSGMAFSVESMFDVELAVKEIDEGGAARFEMRTKRIRYRVSGFAEQEYDSAKAKEEKKSDKEGKQEAESPEEATSRLLARLVDKPVTVRMTPAGKILEVKGFDKLLDDAMKDGKAGDPMMAEMIRQFINDERMKTVLQESLPILPEEETAGGETWKSKRELSIPMLGGVVLESTSTLKELRKDGAEAVIAQKTKMVKQVKDKGSDNPFGGAFTLKGVDGKGEILWDVEAGRPASVKRTLKLKVDSAGEEIPMTVKTVLRHKKAEKEKEEPEKEIPSEDEGEQPGKEKK